MTYNESETIMHGRTQLLAGRRKFSDAALDGIFGGLAGGVAMALYLIAWGLFTGRMPGMVLGMFDGGMRSAPLGGALTHLAVSAVYGLLFGLIRRALHLRVAAWLAGVVYGLVLVTIAEVALPRVSGSPMGQIPTLHFAVAHVVYGAILGLVSERVGARS